MTRARVTSLPRDSHSKTALLAYPSRLVYRLTHPTVLANYFLLLTEVLGHRQIFVRFSGLEFKIDTKCSSELECMLSGQLMRNERKEFTILCQWLCGGIWGIILDGLSIFDKAGKS